MGDVIFLKRREPAGTARESDASPAHSIDELPPIVPWRRRRFDAQLRAIIGVESATQALGVRHPLSTPPLVAWRERPQRKCLLSSTVTECDPVGNRAADK